MILSPEWKYHITIIEPDWDQIQDWCVNNIGEFGKDWYKLGIDIADSIVTGETKTTWYFKREQDIVIFMLRWL